MDGHHDEEGEDREADLKSLPTKPLPEVFWHGHHLQRETSAGSHLEHMSAKHLRMVKSYVWCLGNNQVGKGSRTKKQSDVAILILDKIASNQD